MTIERSHPLAVLIVQILCVITASARAPCCPTSSAEFYIGWYSKQGYPKELSLDLALRMTLEAFRGHR
jgi:hypothetical protein